jgi:hypothetical protein
MNFGVSVKTALLVHYFSHEFKNVTPREIEMLNDVMTGRRYFNIYVDPITENILVLMEI